MLDLSLDVAREIEDLKNKTLFGTVQVSGETLRVLLARSEPEQDDDEDRGVWTECPSCGWEFYTGDV